VASFCRCLDPGQLPLKARKATVTPLAEHALWLRDARGRILLHHESGSRRTGLWKLPLREPTEVQHLPVIAEHRYSITRYRVTLRVHAAAASQPCARPRDGDRWVAPEDLPGLAMAAPFRRVLSRLLEDF
jgi:adenine-specific DNA glycosylase